MRLPALFFLILLTRASPLPAASIQTETTLLELGVLRPDRLSGTHVAKDYYLPLPSRVFDAAASRIRVDVQASPFLAPGSVISIWINDRNVDTARVGKGGMLALNGTIPPGTRADDPARNILKLTVRADLALAEASSAQTDPAVTWIDVLPSSKFTCVLDNAAPDWLSVGRLAITLRPRVEVLAPADAPPLQADLALKLVSWIARSSLHGGLSFPDSVPNRSIPGTDRFVVEPLADGQPQIEITAEGPDRTVHIRASSEAEAAKAWSTLEVAAEIPLPGTRWTAFGTVAPGSSRESGALLRDLDQASMALSKGIGETACTFHFDLARLTRGMANLTLHLSGTTSPVEDGTEPTLAVLLNGRLLFSNALAVGAKSFDWQIALPAAELHGNNEISIVMVPAANSHAVYFWQLNPESSLRVADAAKPAEPVGLLEAATRFAQCPSYQVWLAKSADWKAAAYAVAWLQRVNPARLLEPVLTANLADGRPALVAGSLSGKPPGTLSGFPVSVADGGLRIRSSKDSSELTLSPSGGLGIWQLGELAGGTPAILVDAWGANGVATLENVSAQMADSVWIEGGDVVIGDGAAPVVTFATREAALPALSELPAAVVKANSLSAAEAGVIKLSGMNAGWMQDRWWIIGGLWLLLSAIIIWIFEQGRRRASH